MVQAHTLMETGKNKLRLVDQKAVRLTKFFLETLSGNPMVTVVDKLDASKHKISCTSENGTLKRVVVSMPTYLDWGTPINEAEAVNRKPDRLTAVQQHIKFIQTLMAHGIQVIILKPDYSRLEGVYTRDIGFVIGTKCFRANLVAEARKPEQETVVNAIVPPPEVQIEGGNVLTKKELVFLGIGKRTNQEGAIWLQEQLGTEAEVKPIALTQETLHLDCAFGPLVQPNGVPGGALIYPKGFVNASDIELLQKVYAQTHIVPLEEYKLLGANVSFLGPAKGIIPTGCPTVKGYIAQHGIVPLEHDLTEIVLAEGAGRCSMFPLLRK